MLEFQQLKSKVYVIAEAACSHEGNYQRARNMIEIANAAGCDCIKFQAFNPDHIPNLSKREYNYLVKVGFDITSFEKLKKYAEELEIDFLLTAFDTNSVNLCKELGLTTIKVPSGRVTDLPFIDYIQERFDDIIVSSGMLSRIEIIHLKRKYKKKMKWLHCVTAYPAPEAELNLNALKGNMFEGFSDHTLSTMVPAIAVACGARIIEKHFTMSRGLPGPDQKCSLEPIELMDMMKNIRDIEVMLGKMEKEVMPCEEAMKYRQVKRERIKNGKVEPGRK